METLRFRRGGRVGAPNYENPIKGDKSTGRWLGAGELLRLVFLPGRAAHRFGRPVGVQLGERPAPVGALDVMRGIDPPTESLPALPIGRPVLRVFNIVHINA